VAVGHSNRRDAAAAVEEALAGVLVRGQPKLVLLFASPGHPLEELAGRVRERIGGARLIGCSTAGELAPGHSGMGGLVLWALGGEGFAVASGCGDATRLGLRQAAREAAGCLERLQRRRHTVLVLLADGLGGDQMEVVRGAYDASGIDVPLVGGCAGDYLAMRQTRQLHGQRVMSGAVVAAAISSDRPLGVGVSHGWTPVSEPMLVTDSRDTVLRSLDDRPALEVYLEFFQPPQEVRDNPQAFADFAATHPIGLRRRDRIEMRHITGFDADSGSLLMIAEVPQGGLAFLTEGDFDSVLGAAAQSTEAAVAALEGTPPVGLLLFDCVSRRSVFSEARVQEETDLIAQCSGGIPMAGFYTYGEIARTRGSGGFHNQTLVTLAIG
jgi:hypothetical protein